MPLYTSRRLSAIVLSTASAASCAADGALLHTVRVTATDTDRANGAVARAMAVMDAVRLEKTPRFNPTEALCDIPGVRLNASCGGDDARLLIRGAGLNADITGGAWGMDITKDDRRHGCGGRVESGPGRVSRTLSDRPGQSMAVSDSSSRTHGVPPPQSLRLSGRVAVAPGWPVAAADRPAPVADGVVRKTIWNG